jgi:outer membrane immunogenic protein
MKKSLISATAIALALSAGSAFAADLPSRKEAPVYVPPPPPPLWTGFYVGLNAGGTFGGSDSVTTTVAPVSFLPSWNTELATSSVLGSSVLGQSNGGFIGGGQVGYNYQFGNTWVVGLEADIQGVAGTNSSTSGVGAASPALFPAETIVSTNTATKSLDYLGTVRGRIGYLFTPTLLAYATGGLAYGGVNSSSRIFQVNLGTPVTAGLPSTPFGAGGSYSSTNAGWTVGGGVEWMFLPNWSAKLEYLYYDLGSVTYSLGALANFSNAPAAAPLYASIASASTHFNGHLVRVGVNYHFNWGAPAPVVAKY